MVLYASPLLAAICRETAAGTRPSIGPRDRRKSRRGLEIGPEAETPQAVTSCGVWSYGAGR